MAETLGPSFIPKQNPAKVARRASTRQVYLFTVLSYVVFFSSLVAVAALFIYSHLTTQNVAQVVSEYNSEIASFNQGNLHKVIELDERLNRTADLLNTTISLRTALAVIDAATIDTVQFQQLAVERGEGNQVMLDAVVSTDSFDSVLFQRRIYEQADRLAGVSISGVAIQFLQADTESGTPQRSKVGFSALFDLVASSTLPESALNPEPIDTTPDAPVIAVGTTSTSTLEAATSSSPQVP
jgi:hypothetical protein